MFFCVCEYILRKSFSEDILKRSVSALILVFLIVFLYSCESGKKMDTEKIACLVSEKFPFKYGVVYSDEYENNSEYYFGTELKKAVFGENADKLTYIESVSGYFSRDMVSGSEFIAVRLSDRSHRAEIMSTFYRRAALKTDMDARVFCEGCYVFFVCDMSAEKIISFVIGLL